MSVAKERTRSLADSFRLYRDRRLFMIFVNGIASGFPWVLIGSAMSAWLTEAELTRTAIGAFGSVFAPYSINFLWAPVVERIRIPLLGRMGQRRSWITLCLLVILGCTLAIARIDPAQSLAVTSLLALAIAIASATQDIAIDAYRIEVIGRHEEAKIPHGSAMATSGWWAGFAGVGGVALRLSDIEGWTWGDVYCVLAGITVLLITAIVFFPEPRTERAALLRASDEAYRRVLGGGRSAWSRALGSFTATVVEPFREFFARHGWTLALAILIFVFSFKMGEAFLGRMSIVFYKEVGFTNSDIAWFSKWFGGAITIILAPVASVFVARFGIVRGLIVGGLAMASTNLLFSAIASVGPNKALFAVAILSDNFTSASATVAFVAFISYLTSRAYTATQYALMASLGNLGRTLVAGLSGAMVDALGGNWQLFFFLTAVMVLPSLVLLGFLAKALRPLMARAAD